MFAVNVMLTRIVKVEYAVKTKPVIPKNLSKVVLNQITEMMVTVLAAFLFHHHIPVIIRHILQEKFKSADGPENVGQMAVGF